MLFVCIFPILFPYGGIRWKEKKKSDIWIPSKQFPTHFLRFVFSLFLPKKVDNNKYVLKTYGLWGKRLSQKSYSKRNLSCLRIKVQSRIWWGPSRTHVSIACCYLWTVRAQKKNKSSKTYLCDSTFTTRIQRRLKTFALCHESRSSVGFSEFLLCHYNFNLIQYYKRTIVSAGRDNIRPQNIQLLSHCFRSRLNWSLKFNSHIKHGSYYNLLFSFLLCTMEAIQIHSILYIFFIYIFVPQFLVAMQTYNRQCFHNIISRLQTKWHPNGSVYG